MPSTSLQLNQLFSNPALAQAAKGGGVNFAGLVGDAQHTSISTVDAFESLLAGILKGGKVNPGATVLLGSSPKSLAAGADVPAQAGDVTLEDLLKGLPSEIAAILRAQITAQANGVVLDEQSKGNGILDALSVTPAGADTNTELFAVIDDPELASVLAGLSAQLSALKNNIAFAVPVQGKLQSTVLSPVLLEAAEKIKATIAGLQGKTITIASLDGDGFQALKKIAFADIAPYLTQPRTIVIDGRHVAKIAQGPSFLDDGSNPDVMLLALNAAALAPVIQLQQVAAVETDDGVSLLQIIAAMQAPDGTAIPTLAAAAAPALIPPQLTKTSTQTATAGDEFVATGAVKADAPLAPQTGTAPAQKTATGIVPTPAATGAVPVVPGNTSRGFGDILTDFAQAAQDPLNLSVDGDLQGTLKPQTDSLSLNTTTTLTTARAAGQPHPGLHLVSASLARHFDPRTPGTERSFTIHMEPGKLGRVRVTLEFGENNIVKARLMAERPETLSLLQKDIASLERLLSNNGFDTSSADAFSFDLAEGDSFSQGLHEDHKQNGKSAQDSDFGTDDAVTENVMSIFVDPETGLTHINVTV